MSSIRDLVAEYLGIAPQHGDEWTVLCPSPDHNDNRPSASIYVGEPETRLRGGKATPRLPGMWVCYSCHRAGRISSEAIENYTPTTDRNLEVLDELLDPGEHRIYPESWLSLYDFPGGTHPYYLHRFSEATCRKHKLGYDYERDCVTYPFRAPDGAVLGVVRRSIDTDATGWKYRYPAGVDKSSLLYGYAEAVAQEAQLVVLVEGAFDAIAVDEAGSVGLAIYGSKISAAQVRLINRLYPKRVVLAFDNDAAGRDATSHTLSMGIDCFDIRVADLGIYNDIAEMSVDERRLAIMRAKTPSYT